METINWKVEGMTCSTCALTVGKYLEKQGMSQVKVSLASGDLSFERTGEADPRKLRKGIEDLGYSVVEEVGAGGAATQKGEKKLNRHLRNLLICLPFTLVLLLHMAAGHLPLHWLMFPWVQFVLCLPVYMVGMNFFGRSAVKSLLNGLPNMNVLIAVGATAAFVYSLTGTLFGLGPAYLFYETTASIITLVFFGYYLEDVSVQSTQKALNSLVRSQKTMANMIAFDGDHQEQIFPVESTELRSGDLVLVRSGEQVPADGKILWGEASVNEAIVTGESLPLYKKAKDYLIGGSILLSGTVKVQVMAAGEEAVLAGIVRLVKQAQGEKPPIQQLADKISAVFVPLVLGISLITFVANYAVLREAGPSLMRAVAVLVIACPCAMGLATPAAIAVGLGRAARQGILFRHAKGLESFAAIRQVVFDKTGTLTTGEFNIKSWKLTDGNLPLIAGQSIVKKDTAPEEVMKDTASEEAMKDAASEEAISEEEFKRIAFSLEKYSNHPIAKSIAREWKQKGDIRWAKMEEIKGLGMRGVTKSGDIYMAGSYKVSPILPIDDSHSVYIVRNDRLLGWIDVADTVRPEAPEVVRALHARGIRTVLLSGDRLAPCQELAAALGIEEVLAEQTPEQKLDKVSHLTAQAPTAMVGDGINDAPALAKATIGISMSDASQLAMQTSDLVLMNHGLKRLPAALSLGKHTFLTIRQNLFWAFFYNIIAIPVAAFGLLTPAFAALAMGLSDVVLVFNSVRLFVKKLP